METGINPARKQYGMYRDHLHYLLLSSGKQLPLRYAAIITVLLDTVTTIYGLYVSPHDIEEQNPLGVLLLEHGAVGEVLFMAVPLFTVLLLLYLPGLLGDAVAVSNLSIHLFATGINLMHVQGLQVTAFVPVTAEVLYLLAVGGSVLIGVAAILPTLIRRDQAWNEQ